MKHSVGLWIVWYYLIRVSALSSGRTKRSRPRFLVDETDVSSTPWWTRTAAQRRTWSFLSTTTCRIHSQQQQHRTRRAAVFILHSRTSPDQDEEVEIEIADDDDVVDLYHAELRRRVVLEDGSYAPPYYLEDNNGLEIVTDELGRVTAKPCTTDDVSTLEQDDDIDDDLNDVPFGMDTTWSEFVLDLDGDDDDDDNLQPPIDMASLSLDAQHDELQQLQQQQQRARSKKATTIIRDHPATIVPKTGFNVVLTHATADFDSLASAIGLAKLWATQEDDDIHLDGSSKNDGATLLPHRRRSITTTTTASSTSTSSDHGGTAAAAVKEFDSSSHVPTFVVLPRGAHPGVQKFLALHKHLFPIRSLKSLPTDLSGLNRLGLVDAQRRDRLGPAEHLLGFAKRVTIVDHHIDSESDITEATDYVVDKVGSVSTLMVERLREAELDLSEAEATLLALGIHADTGSLCFDSTTPRDANALAWVMSQGASQAAIAEHARSSLSTEQQGVLTQALIYSNTTVVHGVTVATVLLTADGFINGLAAVTEDALEMSSSDVFLLALVYEAGPGSKKKRKRQGEMLQSRLFKDHKILDDESMNGGGTTSNNNNNSHSNNQAYYDHVRYAEAWRGGDEALLRRRLRAAFDRKDTNGSGFLEKKEIAAALAVSGTIVSEENVVSVLKAIDTDGDGRIDFEEFVSFAKECEKEQAQEQDASNNDTSSGSIISNNKASTMIIIGRVKAGVHMKAVKLNKLLEKFSGGGHPKAASATLRLNDVSEAEVVLQGLVDELIETNLQEQPTVGGFMTAPVLSIKPHMTEKQVEDLFSRYDVRALPVVDDNNDVIGLVTYKEVAAAKQRLWNKEQKRRQQRDGEELLMAAAVASGTIKEGGDESKSNNKTITARKLGSTVKGWMKQHVQVVETSKTMAEVEAILLENDVGCIPVVADGTRQLVGMVTRTDLLRQHRYYPSLHYHNKGFSDSIAARKPIIELRRKLKKFDIENE